MIMVDSKKREVYLYDMIGPSWLGLDAADTLVEALKTLGPGDISVRINSPGGDVFEGYAMYTQLTQHDGQVTTYNDGLQRDPLVGLAIYFCNDQVLGNVDQATRQVSGVRGLQGGVRQTLSSTMG